MVDRHDIHDIRHLHGADEGVVVGKYVTVANAGVVLIALPDHPFDETAHGVDMHHDSVRQRYRIAFGRVDCNHHLADLPPAGGSRNAARHLARRHAEGTKLGVERLEFQRVLLAQGELGHTVIAPVRRIALRIRASVRAAW